MRQPGAALIAHYLDADRIPASERWSRKHAHTQRRLCELYAPPVIAAVTCQDIKSGHMQEIVNAAPTAGEGDRVQRMISALVTAGIDGGYLVNSRLAKVHWQVGDRPLPAPAVSVAGAGQHPLQGCCAPFSSLALGSAHAPVFGPAEGVGRWSSAPWPTSTAPTSTTWSASPSASRSSTGSA